MAVAVITPVKLTRNTFTNAIAANTAVDASDGAEFTMTDKDEKYLIVVENASVDTAKTVTIKAGNGPQGVADLAQSIAAATTRYINIESGKYKNITGDNAGKVLVEGTDANIKLSVYILP